MSITTQPGVYVISGYIYDEHNSPLPKTTVNAYDIDIRSRQELGTTQTDDKGFYTISFKEEAAAGPEYNSPDILIAVFGLRNSLLGESIIYYNIGLETHINYKIGGTEYSGENEFDALLKKVKPIIEPAKIALGELEENDKNKDISFLAGETGEDAEKITFLNIAFAFAKTRKIAPDIFYGLFHMGFPVDWGELLQIKASSIKKALQQAINENIISPKWEKKLDEIINLLNALSANYLIAGDDEQSVAFKKLFGSVFTIKQQQVFTSTYYEHEDAPEIFWDKLKDKSGFKAADIKQAKQLLNFSLLTDQQPELTKYLFSKQAADPDLKEMSGYAKFGKDDWKKQIKAAKVKIFPEWVAGETAKEKIDHYAEGLEALHKQLYPTSFFAARMKQDNKSAFVAKAELSAFFSNNPDFDLQTKNIQKQIAEASFDSITQKEAITQELKGINRLYKLTDDYQQLNALYKKQLFSATDVVSKYGRDQFVQQFADTTGSAEAATMLYKKAVSVSNKALALLTAYKMRHDVQLYAIAGDVAVPEGYHEMFGDSGHCECEHCQSVYSPAAYFVDMLAFIKGENIAAFDELIRRRPDLDDILLTCRNTNTALPYIDLVNELLEKKVLALSAPTGVDPLLIENHSFQTEGTTTELIAMPEHSNSSAYAVLKTVSNKAVFSPVLPLDLPLEEIRIYTEKLGHKRAELLEAFYGKNGLGIHNDINLNAALFGFSNAELAIINGSNAFTVTLSGTVKEILDDTKISYIELLQLLETYFLNPVLVDGRAIVITQTGQDQEGLQLLTCDLNKLVLSGADNAWMNKMARFIRLWKKLGWNVFDLDRVLTSLQLTDFHETETAFNEQLLAPLAHIEKTKRLLNIPLRQLVAFFGNMDTAAYLDHTKEGQAPVVPLFDELFGDAVVTDASTVCAALGISASDYALLEIGADFSLPSISSIYRYVLLAKALRTSIIELQAIINFTGMEEAAAVWSPARLSEFLEQWQVFKSTGINALEFKGFFNAASDAEYTIPVNYRLIRQTEDCLKDLLYISSNAALTEEDRTNHYRESVVSFLDLINNHVPLIAALNGPLTNPADIALKTIVKNYLGTANVQQIIQLPAAELIQRIEALQKSLLDYRGQVLKKAPAIFGRLNFKSEEILWLKDNKAALGIALLWNETVVFENESFFQAFRKLYDLSVLAKIKSGSFWIDLLEIALINTTAAKSSWFESFGNYFSVSGTSLEFLCGSKEDVNQKGQLNFSFPEDFVHAENLMVIRNCCRIMESLGGNTNQFRALLNTTALEPDAQEVRNLLKSKYGNKEWLNVIQPISDRLRTKRRDALVAWLLANSNAGKWQSANDIYELLLIDVEMEPCMVTSRIKQAISSVQLYIDRCLMHLEKDKVGVIIPGEAFSSQWHTWRKQYRVWEANRKIFLYPENWIEPDLRDDKSPFFKELESQLKQNEITEDTAKEALIAYLQKLDAVANLEMVGLFNDEEINIVHVFGRTQNIPHEYFYRKQENSVWSAWEKVDLDIEGDHILPVVWNGRLMLFWAQFTEKQVEGTSNTSISGDIGEMTMSSPPPLKYQEIKLAWSEYKNGKWSAKKISKNFIKGPEGFTPKAMLLNSKISNDKLLITFFWWIQNKPILITNTGLGQFVFDACNSSPEAKQIGFFDPLVEFYYLNINTQPEGIFIKENTGEPDFPLAFYKSGIFTKEISASSGDDVFRNTPGSFTLVGDYQSFGINNKMKAFYSNGGHTLFALARSSKKPDFSTAITSLDLMSLMTRKATQTKPIKNVPILAAETKSTFSFQETIRFQTRAVYSFQTFYHPFVCSYIKKLNATGIDALYQKKVQAKDPKDIFTATEYNPTSLVLHPYPKEEVDFSYMGSYATYNWELFFHIPLLIATRLTQNQKFEEARKWFHYIFDPTRTSNDDAGPERFWITKPFNKEIVEGILPLEGLLNVVENADELDLQLSNWEKNPFNPHAVARLRVSAYMRSTVLRYIDNLIQWGDQLFRRDTIESINEATLLYILAANILGKKPEIVPARATAEVKSFSTIENGLDGFSNAKAAIESFISPSSGDDHIWMPYFCLPKNDYLLKYWDTVADRLFKIRHCMNIVGTVRQLPLFEPPIDPALLVRATAAGLDLNSILDDMNADLPDYRFQLMLQQANVLCNDVKMLGSSLLSTLEKKDGEEMALLRLSHELTMLEQIKDVKEKQRDEAKENLSSLNISKNVIQTRKDYYGSREFINVGEALQLESVLLGMEFQIAQAQQELLASVFYNNPDVKIGSGFTFGFTAGGSTVGDSAKAMSTVLGVMSIINNTAGALTGTLGGYERRMDDWKFQAKSAELELRQIDKQIIAAEIRLAVAEKEIENHSLQMEQSKKVDDYMRSKFTNAELFDWMVGQLSTVYFQSYQLAYSTAKKAEKCLQHELGSVETNYVKFGYWDNLKAGLLAGEKLQLDLRRLEMAHLEQNKREFEITKHISIRQINPIALLELRENGSCTFNLPELLFDMDFPGHYRRRIKSVSISIPCITGPYTGLNATLRLTENGYRRKANLDDDLIKSNVPSTAIAVSTGQMDSGLFELNFRDERYLPFEGAGAISSWKLELPEFRQFDYETISDVVMHVRYTALEEGAPFKTDVVTKVNEAIGTASEGGGLFAVIDLQHDLPTEWHKALQNTNASGEHVLVIPDVSRFLPFYAMGKQPDIMKITFYTTPELEVISPTTFTGLTDIEFKFSIAADDSVERAFAVIQFTLG